MLSNAPLSIILAAGLAVAGHAQTSTSVNFTGNMTINITSGVVTESLTGTGTLSGYGSASLSASGSITMAACVPLGGGTPAMAPAAFTLDFGHGDTLAGTLSMPCSLAIAAFTSYQEAGGPQSGTGSATVTGGTGRFSASTGSFQSLAMSLTITNLDQAAHTIAYTCQASGAGTLAVPATASANTFVVSNEAPGYLITKMLGAGYGTENLYQVLVDIDKSTAALTILNLTTTFLRTVQSCPAASQVFTATLNQYGAAESAVAVSSDCTVRAVSIFGGAFSGQASASTLAKSMQFVGPALFAYSSNSQNPLTSFTAAGASGASTAYSVLAIAFATAAPPLNCLFAPAASSNAFAAVSPEAANVQFTGQGSKLVGTLASGAASQGCSVALSADGNTAIVGGFKDNGYFGAAWIFTRNNSVWSQQGAKLNDPQAEYTGYSVSISGDGNTAISGGFLEPTLVFIRVNGAWQLQAKLGAFANGGGDPHAVALSADGNTAIVGDSLPNTGAGTALIFTRSGGAWTQQATLAATGGTGQFVELGFSVALSSDGSTAVVGGPADNTNAGAAWVFTRSNGTWSQQGAKLVGSGAAGAAQQGRSVALSSDGNTLIVGGPGDNANTGAAWVFTRANGVWNQQGGKLAGAATVGASSQGSSVSISTDGNTVMLGGNTDNANAGVAWIFKRSNISQGSLWTQQGGKLTGAGAVGASFQGTSVAISADASTAIVGGPGDNSGAGAAWAFIASPAAATTPAPIAMSPPSGSGTTGTFAFSFSDTGGWQSLNVVDVLINNVLDGRQACYVAFVPSGANSGSVYLVDDAGDAGGPYSGMVLPGSGAVQNSQCSITGAGSSVAGSGNTLTLTLAIAFTTSFAGNKVMYVAAQDASANSGWQPLGTWGAPGPAVSGPSAGGVSPAHSTGLGPAAYTFTFADTNGWQDISVANVLINSAINGVGACYVAFVPSGAGSGSVYLVDDAGDAAGPYSGMLLPGSSTVHNSQCSIAGTGSSVTAGGNTLTLTLTIAFSSTFTGNRIVYLAAGSSKQNSGWQAMGIAEVQ